MIQPSRVDIEEAFISYNRQDKVVALKLAATLELLGVNTWIDDWRVRPGDSIPGKINEALARVDLVVIVWSEEAAASKWVDTELSTAIARQNSEEDELRVVVIRLDDAPPPPLLAHRKWIDVLAEADIEPAAASIAGLNTQADMRRAIQERIENAYLPAGYFDGYGVVIGCPKCGAALNRIDGWGEVDERRDDMYGGAKCRDCGWHDGGQL
ncbi:MAG: toll/interleukin-1 receptor domain-containing protein [Solirubrobacterales bacterium]